MVSVNRFACGVLRVLLARWGGGLKVRLVHRFARSWGLRLSPQPGSRLELAVCVLGVCVLAGCGWEGMGRRLEPGDFVSPTPQRAGVQADRPAALSAENPLGGAGNPLAPRARLDLTPPAGPGTIEPVELAGGPPAVDRAWLLDALAGQANGNPVYAGRVLEPLAAQLEALGRDLPAAQFQAKAAELIVARVRQIVFDALLLGEAERDLDPRELEGVRLALKERRAELIRRHGAGSPTVAEQTLRRETGRGVDGALQDYRQSIIIARYLQQVVSTRVHVTRRDIERYYRSVEGQRQYNPEPEHQLRMIVTERRADADQIDRELRAGAGFEAVARGKLNQFSARTGGATTARGDGPYAEAALNEALRALTPGRASPRVTVKTRDGERHYWLFMVSTTRQPPRRLDDVQQEVERLLSVRRYQVEQDAYRRRLLREGVYNSVESMTAVVVEVAMARYATR
jgi:hypothetical protein